MRYTAFMLALMTVFPAYAGLDEQTLYSKNQTCGFHYLTEKPKKLWSIQTDESYCMSGFVNGFTSVVLKDALDRTTQTLQGFFYQGYYLSDFIPNLTQFYRAPALDGGQDFIYLLQQNKEDNLTFYGVARAQKKEDVYTPFQVCSEEPVLLAAHSPTGDFKQSLFQATLLKQAKQQMTALCPQAQKLHLIGIDSALQEPNSTHWIFKATMDFNSGETQFQFPPTTEANAVPKPLELKKEQGENLMTVHPSERQDVSITYGQTPVVSESKEAPLSPKSQPDWQSAADLALMAAVTQKTTGKTVVYIETTSFSNSARITRPTPLILKSQNTLASGWYLIEGLFYATPKGVEVELLSATPCLKEWCTHEE